MLLRDLKEDENWLTSAWQLTYRVGWEHILRGVYAVYDSFVRTDVLVEQRELADISKESVPSIEEASNLTIRGMSRTMGVPVMMTFYNQTNFVEVFVAKATDEFKSADYKSFNISMCQFLDSIELAMYRPINTEA